jgi:hypothetical protein
VARIVVVAPGGDSPDGLRSPPREIHLSVVGPLLGLPSPLLIPFRVRTVEHPEASIVVNADLIFSIQNPLKPSLPLLHYYHIFSRPRLILILH